MSVSSFTQYFGLKLIDFDSNPWHQDDWDNITAIDSLIKASLGSVQMYPAGGTANVVELTVPSVSAMSALLGIPIAFLSPFTNTGDVTVTVNGLAAVPLKAGAVNLPAGTIAAAQLIIVIYNGTEFQWVMRTLDPTAEKVLLSLNNVDNKSSATIRGEITPTNIINGLGNTKLSGFRNIFINGEMRIDQFYVGTAVICNSNGTAPIVDMYKFTRSAASGGTTVQRDTDAPAGFATSLSYTVTTSRVATAAEFFQDWFMIEGTDIIELKWGTADAKTVTLSFWAKEPLTGTYPISVMNFNGNVAYVAQYTIAAANTWEYHTVTIPGPTTGSWLTTTGVGIIIVRDKGSGSNFNAPAANAWQGVGPSGGYTRIAGNVSVQANAAAVSKFTGLQFEVGDIATPFEHRPAAYDLWRCQRYYRKTYDLDIIPGTAVSFNGAIAMPVLANASSQGFIGIQYQEMRTTPSATFYAPQTGTTGSWSLQGTSADVAVALNIAGKNCTTVRNNAAPGSAPINLFGHATFDARL